MMQRKEEDNHEKNRDPEGVLDRFVRRVCPEEMFRNPVS
jgi:hypothetical protein